ncbi:MAG: hypothetical protein IPL92_01680 [Saprospiraceae bacterium]|nr:hypothetical protein [Candidatus Opimibacter iunctus]
MPNRVYTWYIQGLGELIGYNKTYSTFLPNLTTSLHIGTNQSSTLVSSRDNFNTTKIKSKRKNDDDTGTPPIDEQITPSWFQVERLPSVGFYKVRLTVSSREKSNLDSLVTYQIIELKNIVIACLGDSYASGEGNPDFDGLAGSDDQAYCNNITTVQTLEGKKSDFVELAQAPRWFEIAAHRSMKSGYALAARYIEETDPHSVVTFINLAVSGAEIQNGLLQPQKDRLWMRKGQLGYLEELVGTHTIDLLLLSIGGNDIGFSDLLTEATLGGTDLNDVAKYIRRIVAMDDSYYALNLFMNDRLRIKKILIAEYPTHLFSNDKNIPIINTNEFTCELFANSTGFLTIDAQELKNLNRIGEALQQSRIQIAQKLGWLYAGGIADKFRNHGYCSAEDGSYWIKASYSCTNQGDTRGTMHPNQKGHAVVKNAVLEKVMPIFFPSNQREDTINKN